MTATEIADNYINGNLSDFRSQLKRATKKIILLVIVQIAEHLAATKDYQYATYSDNGYHDAVIIVDKYL